MMALIRAAAAAMQIEVSRINADGGQTGHDAAGGSANPGSKDAL